MDNDDFDDAEFVDEIVIYTSPEGDEIETVFRIYTERRYTTRHPDDEGEKVPVSCRRFVRNRKGGPAFDDEVSRYLMQKVWDHRQASIKADNREAEALGRMAA